MNVLQIAPGLWLWSAPHPNWGGATDWAEDVNCVYYEAADATVLIDPLVPSADEGRFWAALDRDVERVDRPVAVLLTAPWHQRSAVVVAERYGATIWAHEDGHDRLPFAARSGSLPAGVEAFVPGGMSEGQVGFFIRPHRALVVAEFFMGVDRGLRARPSPNADRGAFDDSLRQLLDLPIEHVLVSHGEPVLHEGRAKIEEALARG
jgi:glyoxylase-like metal-dependent hydrolase (beta-lactamase superfamily II)